MRAWRLYSSLLSSHPRATNIVTAGVVSAVADIAAQRIEYNDTRRRLSATSIMSHSNGHLVANRLVTNRVGGSDDCTNDVTSVTVSTRASPNGSAIGAALIPVVQLDTPTDGAAATIIMTTPISGATINGNSATTAFTDETPPFASLTSLVQSSSAGDSMDSMKHMAGNIWLPDGYRLATMTLYGTIMGGYLFSKWYQFLDRTFIGTSARTVATKVALNQCTMAPINNAGLYGWIQFTDPPITPPAPLTVAVTDVNVAQVVAPTRSPPLIRRWPFIDTTDDSGSPQLCVTFVERWWSKLYAELPATTMASVAFWAPYQAINFRYIQSAHRVLFQSGGVLVWTIWVNMVGHQ